MKTCENCEKLKVNAAEQIAKIYEKAQAEVAQRVADCIELRDEIAARKADSDLAAQAIGLLKDSVERLQKDNDYAIGLINVARTHFENIAAYDTDFTKGPAENVNTLQAIAEEALDALPKL